MAFTEDVFLKRVALLQEIRDSGGEKAFTSGESDVLFLLAALAAEGFIEQVPFEGRDTIIYQLVKK
jgi:hypothetical protein